MAANSLRIVEPPVQAGEAAPPTVLMRIDEVAAWFGVTTKTWRAWDQKGRCPMSVRMGTRAIYWRRDELQEWIEAGLPDREAWNAIKAAKQRRRF